MTEWQQLTWYVFHTSALNYNEQYRDEYINFFDSLSTIIPCSICRTHYNHHINKDDMKIHDNINKERFFNWTVDLHNEVNKMHHKKIWSYSEARNHYYKTNYNNNVVKNFLFHYIRANFKKGPEKTEELFRMIKTLAYMNPNEEKRNKLIDFKEKFDLNRDSIRNWLLAFLIILK